MRQVRNAATITATDKNASASLFRIAVRFAGRLGQRACSDLRHMGMAAGVPIGRGPEPISARGSDIAAGTKRRG